ncbi:hypothetical protein [Geomonas subterranea]|uniref:hypothetical protein n=1 Tax=Geomonas subterranea TaxID=2847989 RepID=UPI001CD780F8|nr:hypothetical protein [Geomonas fuzhouensis]
MEKPMRTGGMELDDLLVRLTEIRAKEGNLKVMFDDMQPFTDAEIDVFDYAADYAAGCSTKKSGKFLHIGLW